jgi:hypothetical protein
VPDWPGGIAMGTPDLAGCDSGFQPAQPGVDLADLPNPHRVQNDYKLK